MNTVAILVSLVGIINAFPMVTQVESLDACKATLKDMAIEAVIAGKPADINNDGASVRIDNFDVHYCTTVEIKG